MSQKHSEQYKIIGQAIKKYRKQRGLTQEQLADRVSISISYLTKIEAPNCDQPFSLEVIFDIAEVLEIPAHVLLEDLYFCDRDEICSKKIYSVCEKQKAETL